MRPLLVVIQGAPGSGKTTIVKQLEKVVKLPIIGKDDVKEFLFDHLEQSDREYSRLQGKASFEMLYAFARTFLEDGKSVVIEGAFHTEVSRKNIEAILHSTNAECIEIFCHVDEVTRAKRFSMRSQDGTRHPAHLDMQILPATTPNNYQRLKLGESISIDTTHLLTQEQITVLARKINEKLYEVA